MITGGRPLLLDLFCGAGGCSRGYQEAGFVTYGVDLNRQRHYIGDWFVQMDALEFMRWLIAGETMPYGLRLADVDAIHASPPCQAYSKAGVVHKKAHPKLITPVRDLLLKSGKPFVIENVEGAPLRAHLMLCGTMFDLSVRRHRYFETTLPMIMCPYTCNCRGRAASGELLNYHNTKQRNLFLSKQDDSGSSAFKKALGVEWMNFDESQEAIPPAYTRYIGAQLLDYLGRVAD